MMDIWTIITPTMNTLPEYVVPRSSPLRLQYYNDYGNLKPTFDHRFNRLSIAVETGDIVYIEYINLFNISKITPDPYGIAYTTSLSPYGVADKAATYGNLDCLRYAHEHGDSLTEITSICAAGTGHLECLRYLHQNGCTCGKRTCDAAAKFGHLDCLRYCLDNGICYLSDRDLERYHRMLA
jgi:hypothetical protein